MRGAILVLGAETRPNIQPADIAVLQRIVTRAASAYHAALLAERDSSVTSGLQRALLPATLPAVEGLTLSVAYAPAASEERSGGDWYDAMSLPDGRILLSIGDVAGHGLEAAVAMSALRNAIRAAALDDPRPASTRRRQRHALARPPRTDRNRARGDSRTAVARGDAGNGRHAGPAIAGPRGRCGVSGRRRSATWGGRWLRG